MNLRNRNHVDVVLGTGLLVAFVGVFVYPNMVAAGARRALAGYAWETS